MRFIPSSQSKNAPVIGTGEAAVLVLKKMKNNPVYFKKLRQELSFYLDRLLLLAFSVFILLAPFSRYLSKRILYSAVFVGVIKSFIKYRGKLRQGVVFVVAAVVLRIIKSFLKYRVKLWQGLGTINIMDKSLVLFFGVAALSTLLSRNIYHSQSVLFERYLPYSLCYFLGMDLCKGKKNIFFLLSVLFLMCSLLFIGGVHDYLLTRPSRIWTSFGMLIEEQVYLIFIMPIVFLICFSAKNIIWKFVSLIILALLFFFLIFIASRSALIAVILSFLFMTGFIKGKLVKKTLVFISICVLLLVPFFMPHRPSLRPSILKSRASIDERVRLFSSSISIFKDFPILGAGPGMYEKLLYKYAPPRGYAEGNVHLHAHNTFLEIAAEMGIVGLMAFLGIFVVYFKNAFKSVKLIRDKNIRTIQVGLMGAIFASLIYALFCTIIIVGLQDAALFWFLLGISSGLIKKQQNEKECICET